MFLKNRVILPYFFRQFFKEKSAAKIIIFFVDNSDC
jgi:DNA-binding transcriptional regulator/RsmH inhibitor MraZ